METNDLNLVSHLLYFKPFNFYVLTHLHVVYILSLNIKHTVK